MIGWLLNQLIEAIGGYVAEFCTWVVSQIASEGLVIFDQPVIQGIIAKVYTIGLGREQGDGQCQQDGNQGDPQCSSDEWQESELALHRLPFRRGQQMP